MEWGLLGPETLPGHRRTRTLGLGAAVRRFNDLAVPGMGNVWFGKQLFLALLGIALAERARETRFQAGNIETANAVEALACRFAFDLNGWQSDPRLRGRQKLQTKDDLSFSKIRKHGYYVTQPMRMVTGEPLLALGFVESRSERFNAMRCAEIGKAFLDAATKEFRPRKRTVEDHLLQWIRGEEANVATTPLRCALSPLEPLPSDARAILRERIMVGGDVAERRKAALSWVTGTPTSDWDTKPDPISHDHWQDLKVGARFFLARDAALTVLDAVEAYIGGMTDRSLDPNTRLPEDIIRKLDVLRSSAQAFLDETYDPSPDAMASNFARDCMNEPVEALLSLVARDERVLRRNGGKIVPGAAFRGHPAMPGEDETEQQDEGATPAISWPEGISPRIVNLFLMAHDLDGKLDQQLEATANG